MSSQASSTPTFSSKGSASGLSRQIYVPILAVAVLCAATVISIGIGPVNVGPWTVVRSLAGEDTGLASTIVNDIRLPRVLLDIMVGASLAMSGAILQGVTRNPLADPHIFGISAGAGAVAVTGTVLFPDVPKETLQPLAFLGGLIGGGVAYAMAWRGGVTPVRLALAGIAVTSMLTA